MRLQTRPVTRRKLGWRTIPGNRRAGSSRLFRIDPRLAPGLYVVSTPIGNLRDITLRALDILASVDVVCAEDTRVAGKLLNAFGVSARLRPYHDHNGAQARPGLLNELLTGSAHRPDVGRRNAPDLRSGLQAGARSRRAGQRPSSRFQAHPPRSRRWLHSGLPTDRFTFAGFPPPKSSARKRFLSEMKSRTAR